MATDQNKPLYTIRECEDRIKEIDTRIEQFETRPMIGKDGPVSVNYQGRINDLQKERTKWERRLEKAKAYDKNPASPESTINGPSVNLT